MIYEYERAKLLYLHLLVPIYINLHFKSIFLHRLATYCASLTAFRMAVATESGIFRGFFMTKCFITVLNLREHFRVDNVVSLVVELWHYIMRALQCLLRVWFWQVPF